MAESEKVANARENMTRAMLRLERDWKREVCFTCIARHPTDPECYMIVTSDPDLKAVAALVAAERPAEGTSEPTP